MKNCIVFILLLLLIFIPNTRANYNYTVEQRRNFEPFNSGSISVADNEIVEDNSEAVKKIEAQINDIYSKVITQNRFINKLDESFQVEYPIGIQGKGGDVNYAIILDQDKITTTGLFLSAYMRFEIPSNGKVIMFKAEGIQLSSTGGLMGDIKLHLVGNKKFKIIQGVDMALRGDLCYVTFDCNGFKNFGLGGDISFSPNLILPEDPKTGKTTNEKIKLTFSVNMTDWNDMLLDLSMTPFQLKVFPGLGFEIGNIAIDLSDTRNPSGMQFPAKYVNSDELNADVNLWRGVYMKVATVRLPGSLNSGKRQQITAANMIIDDLGFTGSFSATNVLPLSSGSIGGWAISIDAVSVDLVKSSITKGALSGKLSLPISEEKQSLTYTATVDGNGDFSFTASSPKAIDVQCFAAKMTIDPSSKITIQKENGEYVATAKLNGSININAPLSDGKTTNDNTQAGTANTDATPTKKENKDGLSISDLKFQELTLTTKAPYFKMGTWSLNSIGYSDKASGFELTLTNIKTVEKDYEKGLQFTCKLSLMKDKYMAEATIAIMGKFEVTQNPDGSTSRHKWKYDRTDFKEITIKVTDDILSLEGWLAVYKDDPTYGNGINGAVTASILPKSLGIQIAGSVMFGNVNNIRYWYFDAMVAFKKGIPMGPVALYGFGGGAYYHMKRANGDEVQLKDESADANLSVIGMTASGIRYVPDESTFFGLKATVIIGTAGDPRPFNGDATFEITFNKNFGVKTIGFIGNGYMMSDISIVKPHPATPISANLDIKYDFDNETMHGVFGFNINAVNGLIKGSGTMEMHFDPHDWYIYVGTPTNRVELTANLGITSAETGAYFVIGTILPPFAPVPENVSRILNYHPDPNEEQLAGGKGFAFGLDFNIKGSFDFLMFYAYLKAGVGFDIMLANYSNTTICEETGEPVGINGWYAQGQAYAYVEGSIGITVDTWIGSASYEILSVEAAVLVAAKLPHPTWVMGSVGGSYSILCGAISGSCHFEFEKGSKCTMKKTSTSKDAIKTLEVIASMTPEKGRTNVSPFASPQVVFNYPVGKEFSVMAKDGSKFLVKIVFDYFKVKQNNVEIIGESKWNGRNDVYAIAPVEMLAGKTLTTLEAKVHYEENKNGSWTIIKGDDGLEMGEIVTTTFTTGDEPKEIDDGNVKFRYPEINQLYVLKDEYKKGYIQLRTGQAKLFRLGSDYDNKARFVPVAGGESILSALQYDSINRIVTYDIPTQLSNSTVYRVELVNLPKVKESIDRNVTQKTQEQTMSGDVKVTMKSQQATGTLTVQQERIIYKKVFRTSKYNTFAQKMTNLTFRAAYFDVLFGDVRILKSDIVTKETFDSYEIDNLNANPNSFVQIKGTNNGWFKSNVNSLVYEGYPLYNTVVIEWRNPVLLNVPPFKAVTLTTDDNSILSTDEEETGIFTPRNNGGQLSYNIPYYVYWDYYEIQGKIIEMKKTDKNVMRYYTNVSPFLNLFMDYTIDFSYVLPGLNIETSKVGKSIKMF